MIQSLLYTGVCVTSLLAVVITLCIFVSPWFFLLTPLGTVALIAGGVRLSEHLGWL